MHFLASHGGDDFITESEGNNETKRTILLHLLILQSLTQHRLASSSTYRKSKTSFILEKRFMSHVKREKDTSAVSLTVLSSG